MASDEIHVGDVGTVFEITIQDGSTIVDLTGYTKVDIILKKPEAVKETKVGVVDGDPTTGIVRYTTITGDLDTEGTWQIQAYVEIPGFSGSSDIGCFEVYANL